MPHADASSPALKKAQAVPGIGFRLREARLAQNIKQSSLAAALGISTSYLNLIEHNKRQVSGVLLQKLARKLELDLSELSGAQEARLINEIANFSDQRLFARHPIPRNSLEDFVTQFPEWARVLVKLYQNLEQANQDLDAAATRMINDPQLANLNHQVLTSITSLRSISEILSDTEDLDSAEQNHFTNMLVGESSRLSDAAQSMFEGLGAPTIHKQNLSEFEQVDDFLAENQCFFPALEAVAEETRGFFAIDNYSLISRLTKHLSDDFGFQFSDLPQNNAIRVEIDLEARTVKVPPSFPPSSFRFVLARLYATLKFSDLLTALTTEGEQAARGVQVLTTTQGKDLAYKALASYFAGALLFPYDSFLEIAKELRYDIDMLSKRFNASFEQICHRLVTLRKPGHEGIPFAFMRTDLAGNVSKRFSIQRFRLPRYGSACPLWAVYRAPLNAGRVLAQAVALPEGEQFLQIAAAVRKDSAAYGLPRNTYSLMIACDAAFADQMVYGDQLIGGAQQTILDVGVTCQRCPRRDCQHRAFPMMKTDE